MSPRFFSPATLLLWCSHPAQVLQTLPPLPGCQHVPVVFSYLAVESECFARGEVSEYLWYKGDNSSMNEELADVDWDLGVHVLFPGQQFYLTTFIITIHFNS